MQKRTSGFGAVIIVAAIAAAMIIGAIYYNASQQTTESMMEDGDGILANEHNSDAIMEEDEAMQQEDAAMKGEGAMMEDNDSMMEKDEGAMLESEDAMMDDSVSFSGSVLAGSSSLLIDFNQADYQAALASDKLVALYFYANWCPVCKEEVANALYPAFNELDRNDVVGFRVNYNDTETDSNEEAVAREFGVAYQHTKVFVKNGERVLKSPESWNKERYVSEIEQAL